MDNNCIKINTFNQIHITSPNTLVICDIDKTLLYWNKEPEDFYSMVIDDDYEYKLSPEEIYKEATSFLNMYTHYFPPIPTDLIGWNNLENQIIETESKLIFLTARTKSISETWTEKNFKDIGLDYNKYQIYYTDNILSKGDYINQYIDLTPHTDVIFIDDMNFQLDSVYNLDQEIKCYQFEIISNK